MNNLSFELIQSGEESYEVVTGQIRQLLVEIKYGNSLTFLVT